MKNSQISITIEENLDREELVGFLSGIFDENSPNTRAAFEAIFDFEPSIAPRNFILARSDQGELAGVVRVVERQIFVDGVLLECGGVSSVCVAPQWRNQGISFELMKEASQIMKERGMDISVLYARRALDGYYSRFGYYGIGRYVDLEIISKVQADVSLNLVPFKKEDLQFCQKCYKDNYDLLSGSVGRSSDVWEFLYGRNERGIDQSRIYMFHRGNDVLGYCVIQEGKMIEMGLPSQYFSAVAGRLKFLDVNSIALHPRHPFSRYCRTRMNTIQKERLAFNGGYMAKIINPESLLRKIAPALVKRAADLGLQGQTISLLNSAIDLSTAQVTASSRGDDIVFDQIETAIQLVLGFTSLEDIPGVRWNHSKPWIPYLFPGLSYHTSRWDEI